jgi:tRNA pseudouridine38-40 synthase
MQRNLRLTVEYEGTHFHGWQRQPAVRSVQGELEDALATLVRHPVTLYAAGRTDRGVHALGQVASFRTSSELPVERIRRGANALTGHDVVVRDVREVGPDFHARHSARARHYCYLVTGERSALWAARALYIRGALDLNLMHASAGALVGEHDFAALSCQADEEDGTRSRVLYARWEPWPRGWMFRVGAVRFLYHMVRCMVALGLEIGLGRRPPDALRAALAEPTARCRLVAPAHGLYLAAVDYEDDPPAGVRGPDCVPPGPVL